MLARLKPCPCTAQTRKSILPPALLLARSIFSGILLKREG